jgi:hypothetical protein
MLDRLIPLPRKLEVDTIELAAAPAAVWEHVRHGDLAEAPLARALFALRTLPSRVRGEIVEPGGVRIDDLQSTVEHPGFALLGEEPPRELTVGAIGKVWQLDIPFRHVCDANAYIAFAEPGWVKVAWAIRIEPSGDLGTRLTVELRVDATDEESWRAFARYWHLVGPGSHFIRHAALGSLARHFRTPEAVEDERPLAGDEWLSDAAGQLSQAVTIHATPEAIWPWLLQIGCRRAGYYAIDELDNAGVPSAREVHPELQQLVVGQIIPATPDGKDGFEVLAIEPRVALVLGGLFDADQGIQRRFIAPRPTRYWQITWAFVLEPIDAGTTRLHARARAAFSRSERMHAAWIRPVHTLMQKTQLRHLAARAEGRLSRDTWRDVAEGVGGAAIMLIAWLTPFLRPARSHWGLSAADAALPRPGDALIPDARWSWTHAVDVNAPAQDVWPWIAQVGAGRGGFYSYQWLENVAGCNLRNAEAIHAEWQHREGDELVLHPKMPPLRVVELRAGRHLVAYAAPDEAARKAGRAWAAASWAFCVEPLGRDRCRVLSRFRTACSEDVATRMMQGPMLLEPVGFAMDRRMLLGIRDRVHKHGEQ